MVADTGVAYDGLEKGNLYLYRTEQSLEKGVAHTAILREQGVEMRVLDRDGLAGIEPALDPVKDRLAGGMHAPGDQSGDARMFTRNLAAHCAEHLGVRFVSKAVGAGMGHRLKASPAGGQPRVAPSGSLACAAWHTYRLLRGVFRDEELSSVRYAAATTGRRRP